MATYKKYYILMGFFLHIFQSSQFYGAFIEKLSQDLIMDRKYKYSLCL